MKKFKQTSRELTPSKNVFPQSKVTKEMDNYFNKTLVSISKYEEEVGKEGNGKLLNSQSSAPYFPKKITCETPRLINKPNNSMTKEQAKNMINSKIEEKKFFNEFLHTQSKIMKKITQKEVKKPTFKNKNISCENIKSRVDSSLVKGNNQGKTHSKEKKIENLDTSKGNNITKKINGKSLKIRQSTEKISSHRIRTKQELLEEKKRIINEIKELKKDKKSNLQPKPKKIQQFQSARNVENKSNDNNPPKNPQGLSKIHYNFSFNQFAIPQENDNSINNNKQLDEIISKQESESSNYVKEIVGNKFKSNDSNEEGEEIDENEDYDKFVDKLDNNYKINDIRNYEKRVTKLIENIEGENNGKYPVFHSDTDDEDTEQEKQNDNDKNDLGFRMGRYDIICSDNESDHGNQENGGGESQQVKNSANK